MPLQNWLIGILVVAVGGYAVMSLGGPWPPKVGETFPDVQFTNYDGSPIRLSDFKGKVVLVEPIGMTCPACNAFSGGNNVGGFKTVRPQSGVQAISDTLDGVGVSLGHPDFVFIQVLLYDMSMNAPTVENARIWAAHFGLEGGSNVYVVIPNSDLRGRASFAMIPGFFLVDKNSVVRFDATGHRPRHNLFSELLPSIPGFLSN